MNLQENIRESLWSIQANKLRSILTILTITIGITCLVGMLTAVEGMRQNYLSEFARLGVNAFTVHSVRSWRHRRQGIAQKDVPRIKYLEAIAFAQRYNQSLGVPSIRAGITGTAQLVREGRKTDPNIRMSGVDEHYLTVESLELDLGRNFSPSEIEGGNTVAIIGHEAYVKLFPANENPIGAYLMAYGTRYKIIGKLKKLGTSGQNKDRHLLVPLQEGRRLKKDRNLWLEIIVQVHRLEDMEEALGLGTGLMRSIRGDAPTAPESFEVERSDDTEQQINTQMNILRIVGYIIGIITLMGACVGLMNIMLIYVKERTQEIGVRKAVGATAYDIRMQFLTEAIFICQIGGWGGILFGLLIGNGTAALLKASFVLPWGPMLVGMLVSAVVGGVAGYIPANYAAQVDPIESLRYE